MTKSDFDSTLFHNDVYDVLSRSKVLCYHLVSVNETSAAGMCSKTVSSWSAVHL